MNTDEKIQELEAILVHLSKRIEKLEGRSRMAVEYLLEGTETRSF